MRCSVPWAVAVTGLHCSTDCYIDDTKLLMSFQVQDCEQTMAAMNNDLIKLRVLIIGYS